jgi:hypothetical protein
MITLLICAADEYFDRTGSTQEPTSRLPTVFLFVLCCTEPFFVFVIQRTSCSSSTGNSRNGRSNSKQYLILFDGSSESIVPHLYVSAPITLTFQASTHMRMVYSHTRVTCFKGRVRCNSTVRIFAFKQLRCTMLNSIRCIIEQLP